MISPTQFAVNNIKSLSDPGGEGTFLSQTVNDPLRKLVNLKIVEGFSLNYEGKITVEIEGINLQASDTVYESGCYESNSAPDGGPCFVESGIWTQALETNRGRPSVSPTEWFVSGDLDPVNAVYIIDFGYIASATNEIIILERNVSVYSNLKVTSLLNYPNNTKVAILKRVTLFTVQEIDYAYGEFRTPFFLPRSFGASTLNFTAEDQRTDLEDISISLLILLSAETFVIQPNQLVYHPKYQIDNEIEVILTSTLARLIKLIDTSSFSNSIVDSGNDKLISRTGSIPRFIATFTSNAEEYNTVADEAYRNPTLSCYEEGCFEVNSAPDGGPCYVTSQNKTLINRQVDNRAVAWFSLLLANYIEVYEPEPIFLEFYNLVIAYLYRQQNNQSGFFYKGWTDNLVYANSELIVEEDSSTNVMICIALVKGFEITKNSKYLIEACQLFTNIEKQFLNENNLYINNFTDEEVTVESVIYQLLIYSVFEEYANLIPVKSWLESRLQLLGIGVQEAITDTALDIVTDSSLDPLTTSGETIEIATLLESSLFNLTMFESSTADSSYISKLNYLGFSSIQKINTSINIFNIEGINSKLDLIFNNIVTNRDLTTLVFSSGFLVDNVSIFDLRATKLSTIKYVKNLDFHKAKILDVLKRVTPTGFSWFSESALTMRGNLGQLYSALALPLASMYTETIYTSDFSVLRNVFGVDLNRMGRELGVRRLLREPDDDYRIRIQRVFKRKSDTKLGIEESLTEYDTISEVLDNYPTMLITESNSREIGTNKWGEGYFPGNEFSSPNIISINVEGPIEPQAYKRLTETVPAGVKYRVREVLLFQVSTNPTIDLRLVEDSEGCPAYTTQNNSDFITEGGFRICLEDAPLS